MRHMRDDIELPEWSEIFVKRDAGEELTAVEQFIFNNEPAGKKSAEEWRAQLKAVLEHQ
jgi:hypothetical protein